MSRGVFGALKDAVLILDEIKRLNENVRKLVDRVESMERRSNDVERDRAVGAARDEALIAKFEAATRAAAAEARASLIERIVRLEHAAAEAGKTKGRSRTSHPRLGGDEDR